MQFRMLLAVVNLDNRPFYTVVKQIIKKQKHCWKKNLLILTTENEGGKFILRKPTHVQSLVGGKSAPTQRHKLDQQKRFFFRLQTEKRNFWRPLKV